MPDAAPLDDWFRLRRWTTRAVWPLVAAVPTVPMLVGVLLNPPGSTSGSIDILGTLTAICGVLLLGLLFAGRLLEAQWRRTGLRLVTAQQSWALAVLAGAAVLFVLGVLAMGSESILLIQGLVYGGFAMTVSIGAVIVLALRALRAAPPEPPPVG